MFLFGALFAAGLSFTACSSDNVADEVNDPGIKSGKSYVSFAVNLPTDPSSNTRAANDVYKYGLASEYAVNSIKVFIFEGNSSSSILKEVLSPSQPDSWSTDVNTDATQVIKRHKFVEQLTNSVSTPYALVVLNDPGITYTVGSSTLNSIATQAISVYYSTASSTNYFTMTNAPLSNKIGNTSSAAGANVNTLVPVDIYASQTLADAASPNEIYVERVAVKVTVSSSSITHTSTAESLSGTIKWWAVDNMEPNSYLVRQIDNTAFGYKNSQTTNYRFVGSTPMSASDSQYRIYWGYDPQYSGITTTLSPYNAGTTKTVTSTTDGMGDNSPVYCLENTFDLANQTLQNTTRVVIAVQFGTDDFYVINGATTTRFNQSDMESQLKAAITNHATIQDAVNNHVTSPVTLTSSEITLSTTITNGVLTITNITLPTSVSNKFDFDGDGTSIEGSDADDTSTLATKLSEVKDAINTAYKVEFYDDGMAYYSILIKHFANDLAPWSVDYNTGGGIYDKDGNGSLDATDDAEYLGRYGVLRNNWYNITVSAIKKIGSPVVTSVIGDTTTDDTTDQWIAYAINILSWAYRNQSEDL